MNGREKLLLVWAVVATGLVVVGGVILFGMVQPRFASSVRVGSVDEFAVGSHTLFTCDRALKRCQAMPDGSPLATDMRYFDQRQTDFQEPWIWLTHDSDGEWRALVAISTHRGCFVNWRAERGYFEDVCASAQWFADGRYYTGPAPRDLDWYPVRLESEDVWIDFELMRGVSHN